ncbi:MAG: hypothetical protein JWR80_2341 [Bradyrhizobium sp.]|nr:hypothetical protein [Bradyrhizobium sp.]
MQRTLKMLASWMGAAFWWLFGQLYGESIFLRIRPMIPAWIVDPSWDRTAQLAVVYGPPIILFALGAWFGWTNYKRGRAEPRQTNAVSRDVWLSNALWRVAIGQWARPDLEGRPTDAETRARLELAATRIGQAARERAIPVWHLHQKIGLYKPTPQSLWNRAELDVQTVIGRAPPEMKYIYRGSAANTAVLVPDPKFKTSRKAVEDWLAGEN